jgi:hypothetical protein
MNTARTRKNAAFRAGKSARNEDKAAWLKMAEDWQQLAESAASKSEAPKKPPPTK